MKAQFLGATAALETVQKESVVRRVNAFQRLCDATLGNRRQYARFAGVISQAITLVPQVQGG
jgi:hypothetical protein